MIRQQFIRFAAIGLGLNAALYGSYLLLTHTLMGSQSAMTVTYCSGVMIGFLLNRNITFRHHGGNRGALSRYIAAYFLGYGINFLALWIFADRLGMAHEIVQAVTIVVVAVVTFCLQRYWVFPARISDRLILSARSSP